MAAAVCCKGGTCAGLGDVRRGLVLKDEAAFSQGGRSGRDPTWRRRRGKME